MGIHAPAICPSTVYRRISELSTDDLFDLAFLIGVRTDDAPDTDLYDWLRQRIIDYLYGT